MPVASKINPDIKEERDKVEFNLEEFTNWYHGGADKVKEKRFLGNLLLLVACILFKLNFSENFFLNDPDLKDKVATSYLSHTDVYEDAIRKATIVLRKLKELEVQGRGGKELYA